MTLEEARSNVGRAVAYQPRLSDIQSEHGLIISVGDCWVFVRYGTDTNAKATSPLDLTLL